MKSATDPAWVGAQNGVMPMTGVEGVLIDRLEIALVQVQPG
jgi:hypothetical protein